MAHHLKELGHMNSIVKHFQQLTFTLLLLFAWSLSNGQSQRKPNVIIIFTDDQGTKDVTCYGSKDLITPNIDNLAQQGIRFTRFYASSPLCSPSRAALLTGRYPHRARVPVLVNPDDPATDMPAEEVTIAEVLKQNGYATAHVGKWHLGHRPGSVPNDQGFDHSFGHLGGCIDNYSHFFYWAGPNRHDLYRNGKEVWEDGKYFPDLMVAEASKFIEENKEKPFFLYWAINTPHYPLQPEVKWREKYKHLPHPRRDYAAFVSTTDEKIGALVKKLDDLGLRENTIIVFMSDHGHSVEERTFGSGGNAGPYRGAKRSMFEGGIRVPAIISWPMTIAKNEVREQMGTGTDWFPTLLELCDVSLPNVKLDGKSLVSVLKNKKAATPHSSYHWALDDQWAVQKGSWKLIGNPVDPVNKNSINEKDKLFLVNLNEDESETNNLYEQYPEKVKELLEIHDNWENDLGKLR